MSKLSSCKTISGAVRENGSIAPMRHTSAEGLKRRIAIACLRAVWIAMRLSVALLFAGMAAAQTTVLFSNIATLCSPYPGNQPGCGYYPVFGPTGDFAYPYPVYAAAQFSSSTGGMATDVRVVTVQNASSHFGCSGPGCSTGFFNVAIYSDADGLPGAPISRTVMNMWAPYCCNSVIATASFSQPVALKAGTPYWIVLTPGASSTYLAWVVGGLTPVPVAQTCANPQQCSAWSPYGPSPVQFAVDSGTAALPPLTINTKYIPEAVSGYRYSSPKLAASGGTGTGYTWFLFSGTLPTGFT